MDQIISEILFLGQRFNRSSLLDIFLVTVIVFVVLSFIQGAQAKTLLRGTVLIFGLLSLLYILVDLPAFTWLLGHVVPSLLLIVPVMYAPEIRRTLERIGRVESFREILNPSSPFANKTAEVVPDIVSACRMLAGKNHGALIVIQRYDDLEKFVNTGVYMDAVVTPETLANIFFPNTPLHDGATIIRGARIQAAACIMPLSSRNVLDKTPGRQMGLRHRAALGTSEMNDSFTIVVSEETGQISVAFEGVIYKHLDAEKLESWLRKFFHVSPPVSIRERIANMIRYARDRFSRRPDEGVAVEEREPHD